jgi:hypothetical protein
VAEWAVGNGRCPHNIWRVHEGACLPMAVCNRCRSSLFSGWVR